jgi:hypothetical protein
MTGIAVQMGVLGVLDLEPGMAQASYEIGITSNSPTLKKPTISPYDHCSLSLSVCLSVSLSCGCSFEAGV